MIRTLSVAGALLLTHSAAFAEGQALALKAGALGLGVEYTYTLNERIAFRAGINGSQVGFDREESGIEYDFDFEWDSWSLGVDVHPWKTPLRFSGGLLRNDNRLEGVSRATQNTTVGNRTYTPAQIGTLTTLVEFDDTAPFVGLGWDWSRGKEHFGMSFDIGVLNQGEPLVDLSGRGGLAGSPSFEEDIAAEEAELNEELKDLDLMPYATVGFVFRF